MFQTKNQKKSNLYASVAYMKVALKLIASHEYETSPTKFIQKVVFIRVAYKWILLYMSNPRDSLHSFL